jgi:hypothetical protein
MGMTIALNQRAAAGDEQLLADLAISMRFVGLESRSTMLPASRAAWVPVFMATPTLGLRQRPSGRPVQPRGRRPASRSPTSPDRARAAAPEIAGDSAATVPREARVAAAVSSAATPPAPPWRRH